jgi:hypothetical protein
MSTRCNIGGCVRQTIASTPRSFAVACPLADVEQQLFVELATKVRAANIKPDIVSNWLMNALNKL